MIVKRDIEDESLVSLCVPFVFFVLVFGGGLLFLFDGAWLSLSALVGSFIWLIAAFRTVQPAFAGLVLRFGSRVIIGETIQYFRVVNGQEEDVAENEFNSPDFDEHAMDILTEIILKEYLVKKEGWTLVCPIVERIVKISLQQREEIINKQRQGESDDDYKNRAESFTTSEGVSIFPALFCLYRVKYPGKVIELEGDIDEWGVSPALTKMIHDFVLSGARGIMAKMKITEILNREVKEENGDKVPIGEKIKNEMILSPNFEKLGAEVLTIRLLDVKFTKEAQDVLDALENIKKEDLSRRAQIIEADTKLKVQKKASETLVNKSKAELTEAKNKALAENAKIAAFVGKNLGKDPTMAEDGEKYAKFQIGLKVAESLASGTKVIIPAGDVSKVMAGLVNVFEASKPDASK